MPGTRRFLRPLVHAPKPETAFQIDLASCGTAALDFTHAFFTPLHYAGGYAYPLIVWLHGNGDDERQLLRIMPLVSMRNYVAAAPQGICLGETQPSSRGRFGWSQSDEHIRLAEQQVFDCVELSQRRFNVHAGRVFLAGFSAGGTMALRLAMSHPNQFAGVISLCGAMPSDGPLFGNLITARRLGMFLATGRDDCEYPAEQACADLRLLHTAGLSITLRQYPGGHQLAPQMLADVNRWIMEQISPPPAAPLEPDAEWSYEAD